MPGPWEELCERLRALEDVALGADGRASERLEVDGLRYLARYASAGVLLCLELADPDYPEFGRMVDTTCSWGIDNPDCIYLYAAVRGDARYRIRGRRGGARHLDLQVSRGHFAEAPDFGVIASLSEPELRVDADGGFEIVVAPDPQPGNWLASAPDAGWILCRQYFEDWEREAPAILDIERLDARYPPPPLGREALRARFARLGRWLDGGARYFDGLARLSLGRPENSIVFITPKDAGRGGLADLAYGLGNFRCGPDEAVILEVAPPACHYWSFALGDRCWQSLDWARRQTSLNRAQARLDADGVLRAVIAQTDPGVPNWLDPAGHGRGTLFGRYLRATDVPEPRMRVVPLRDLRGELPPDTPRVTPEARSEALRRRERAVRRRNRH